MMKLSEFLIYLCLCLMAFIFMRFIFPDVWQKVMEWNWHGYTLFGEGWR